jgi:hypothetical protein
LKTRSPAKSTPVLRSRIDQVGLGVAVEGDQLEAVSAHLQRAGGKRAGRGDGLGAGHPVASQAVHVFVEAAAFAVDALMVAGSAARVSGAKAWLPRKWSGW